MACKSKKPKPPKKTIDDVAIERAKERLGTVDKARMVKLVNL